MVAMARNTGANPVLLKSAYLIAAGSPKQAFYNIWIDQENQAFRVCKASGAEGRVWHRQAWEFPSLDEALFQKRLREKTNPARRSRRQYRLGWLLPVTRGTNRRGHSEVEDESW